MPQVDMPRLLSISLCPSGIPIASCPASSGLLLPGLLSSHETKSSHMTRRYLVVQVAPSETTSVHTPPRRSPTRPNLECFRMQAAHAVQGLKNALFGQLRARRKRLRQDQPVLSIVLGPVGLRLQRLLRHILQHILLLLL